MEKKRKTAMAAGARRAGMGLVIGVAAITPGLSGGVIAAAAGLYEPAVRAMVNVRRQFWQSIWYLLPLALGAGAGVLLFGNVMKALMATAASTVLYVFLGLVTGSFPALVKEARAGGFRPRYLWAGAAAFALVLLLENWVAGLPAAAGARLGAPMTLLSGGILAVGTIMPGISSSFVLMQLGVYEQLLDALTGFDMQVLALFAVGFGVTALGMVVLVHFLFKRLRGYTYCAVIGFLLGSGVMVFPGFRAGWGLALDLVLFAAGAAGCAALMRLAPGKAEEPAA